MFLEPLGSRILQGIGFIEIGLLPRPPSHEAKENPLLVGSHSLRARSASQSNEMAFGGFEEQTLRVALDARMRSSGRLHLAKMRRL